MRIGMFDSGIGGLTVLKSFLKYHPDNEYIYYGDILNMPYGDKTKGELLDLSTKIINFLESKKVDIIVIACGTVSSNLYEELKKISKVPIYSIINEVSNYIKEKNYKNLLVMATTATINTHVFKNMASNAITELACPKLVPLIETKNDKEIEKALNEYLIKSDYDGIILGCTHYPIIKDKIKEKLNKNTEIIELGEILAKKIKTKDSYKSVELYFSKEIPMLKDNVNRILFD